MRTEVVHQVETPEYVVFDFELAGLASRALAWGIDALVMGALSFGLLLFAGIAGVVLRGFAVAVYFAAVFVLQFGYFAVLEWARQGQTVGKRVVGLRVMRLGGGRVGFYEAMVRNLLRVLDSLPVTYLAGAGTVLASRRRQRLGDLLAGTVVVRESRRPLPAGILPEGARYNSLVEDRRALAAARARVTPALREILVSLALRREEIAVEARMGLFGRLAGYLEDLGVPRPAALSDERFVLGATAAVLGDTAVSAARARDRAPVPARPVPPPPVPPPPVPAVEAPEPAEPSGPSEPPTSG